MIKIIKESPYVDYGTDNIFDLELENYNSSEDIIIFISDILSGKEFTDKYGNTILLNLHS
jgi:hypothetical protein